MGNIEQWKKKLGGGRMESSWRCLLEQIEGIRLQDKRDKVICTGTEDEDFSVAWGREMIVKKLQQRDNVHTIWNKWIPRKSNILFWRLRRGRIPVRVNLKKMKIDIPVSTCPCCNQEEETVNHIFFHCPFAMSLWDNFCRWWSVELQRFGSFKEMDEWVDQKGFKGRKANCIYASIVAVCQAIWDARNGIIFRNTNFSVVSSTRKFKEDLLLWLRSRSSKIRFDVYTETWSTAASPPKPTEYVHYNARHLIKHKGKLGFSCKPPNGFWEIWILGNYDSWVKTNVSKNKEDERNARNNPNYTISFYNGNTIEKISLVDCFNDVFVYRSDYDMVNLMGENCR